MARINVYLPDELAQEAREARLNVSGLTQDAVRQALSARRADTWLDELIEIQSKELDLGTVLAAVREARDELERGRG